MNSIDTSIIIVNYFTSHLINDCLKSIKENTYYIEYEIIIVDNNTEKLSEAIDSYGIKYIKYIQLNENIGFGRANNKGIEIAVGRNIFLLNPDTLLLNNAVKILSDYLDANPKCGACGGNLFDKYFNPIHSYVKYRPGIIEAIDKILRNYPSRLFFKKKFQHNYTKRIIKVGYITGADLMIPSDILKRTGSFKDDFFMYYEETDLCFRIAKLGYKIVSIPQAKIIHLGGQSIPNEDKIFMRDEYFQKGLSKYMSLNFNNIHKLIAYLLYQLYYSLEAVISRSALHKERMLKNRKNLKRFTYNKKK